MLSRTVPSYSTRRSCSAFTRRRSIYPECLVCSDLSMRFSREFIASKKNSNGSMPSLYPWLTKPRAFNPISSSLKCDVVLSVKPRCILSPSSDCWPTNAHICVRFTKEPLAPVMAIITAEFSGRSALTMPPASFEAMPPSCSILFSSRVLFVMPAVASVLPAL